MEAFEAMRKEYQILDRQLRTLVDSPKMTRLVETGHLSWSTHFKPLRTRYRLLWVLSETSCQRNSFSASVSPYHSSPIGEATQVCCIGHCEATTPTSTCTCQDLEKQLPSARIFDREMPLLVPVLEYLETQRQLLFNTRKGHCFVGRPHLPQLVIDPGRPKIRYRSSSHFIELCTPTRVDRIPNIGFKYRNSHVSHRLYINCGKRLASKT